jgi:hypothetical protein
MKIFLDTANLDEIQQASDFGLLDGITTNPTLAAREGRPFRELILKACEIVKDGVVNAEVVSTDTDGMLREGRELASWHSNIVVKVPMTPAGVRALHVLHGEGIRINVTLVFSAAQALLVAKAGAYFVSPFLGRYGAGWTACAQRNHGYLPCLSISHAGIGCQPARSAACCRGGKNGRPHWHDAVQGFRAAFQAPADGCRSGIVLEGLAKGAEGTRRHHHDDGRAHRWTVRFAKIAWQTEAVVASRILPAVGEPHGEK